MGFFGKLFKGPEVDMEKSNANAKKMRLLFDQAVEGGSGYRLIFGYTEDVEELFSLPLDKRPKGGYGKGKTRRKVAEEMIAPEIQFLREYVRRMGGNNECSVKAYWQFAKNHLVTINKDEIGLFWPKYEGRYSENTQNGSYYLNEEKNAFHCYNFDFVRWLSLYQGTLVYDQKYEEYAEFIL